VTLKKYIYYTIQTHLPGISEIKNITSMRCEQHESEVHPNEMETDDYGSNGGSYDWRLHKFGSG
jgi:hypothetical protein